MSIKPLLCIGMLVLTGCIEVEKVPEEKLPIVADVVISNQALQCRNDGLPVSTTKAYLTDAEIEVLAVQCGHAWVVTAACDTTAGEVHIYTIKIEDVDKAENLGFTNAEDIEGGYTSSDCEMF